VRPAPPARPGHAGRLPLWERVTFAVVFALMLVFVILISVSGAHARSQARRAAGLAKPGPARGPASAAPARPGGRDGAGLAARRNQPADDDGGARSRAWNRGLAAALAPVLARQTGHLAVGVIDETTGVTAVYGGALRFHTASIVKADILATLLLHAERARTPLTDQEADLAAPMIEASDDDAATTLWNLAGAAAGVADANVTLGLRHTTTGADGYWGLTSTTVGDQLRLLRDLTSAHSPLDRASRDYELGLMRDVEADQRWGVGAAATPGTAFAIKNGWLPDGPAQLWVINSIGSVDHGGDRLLMAVLSSDQPTKAVGIAQDQAAADAAAAWVTGAVRPG
jgi:beta-lactamase class A